MFLKQKGKTWVNSISHVKEVKYLGTICRLKLALSVSDWKYISEPNDRAFPGSLSYCHTTSAHKPFLFTASHHHTYNSILTNFSPQSIPRSKKQVFEITTVSEAGGNRASGEQWVFLNTTGDFSVIIDDRAAAYSMETDQMIILTAWAFQTYPRKDITEISESLHSAAVNSWCRSEAHLRARPFLTAALRGEVHLTSTCKV